MLSPWGRKELDMTDWLKVKKVINMKVKNICTIYSIYYMQFVYTIYIYIYNSWQYYKNVFLYINHVYILYKWSFLIAQMVENLPAMQETRVWSLCPEDPLKKEMATHSSSQPNSNFLDVVGYYQLRFPNNSSRHLALSSKFHQSDSPDLSHTIQYYTLIGSLSPGALHACCCALSSL